MNAIDDNQRKRLQESYMEAECSKHQLDTTDVYPECRECARERRDGDYCDAVIKAIEETNIL